MSDDTLIEHFERSLHELCGNERIQAIESGAGDAAQLWSQVNALGFGDALVSADKGGAGLSFAQAGALMAVAARCGLPHPLGDTMVARSLLRAADWNDDGSCIALAQSNGETLGCALTAGAQLATFVLLAHRDEWLLLPVAEARREASHWRPHASASLRWEDESSVRFRIPRTDVRCEDFTIAIEAACLSGTMDRVLALSVQYANDRQQFGRAIGQFQAVQQDLAVMAEQANYASMAARMAGSTAQPVPNALLAATGKITASEAALRVATLAHAVHGAIGITQEHVLGLFTSRLHEWRMCGASEHACALAIGAALVRGEQNISSFVRQSLTAAPAMEA